jgi:succinoglycan biosynthesis protein ExoV
MKNVYYKSTIGNFGDDLNKWLWPKIFKNIDDGDDNLYFIGIGSILDKTIIKRYNIGEGRKIVFGTGVRPSLLYPRLNLDDTWDIKFLRGPLSAQVFENKYEYIADAAYALRHLDCFPELQNTKKQYKISLMPYYKSLTYVNWEKICKQLGYHYISPCSEKGVEFTIKEIAASEKLVAEAMHGSIVADILRVPWRRFVFSTHDTEYTYVSEFKWKDWLFSIGITNIESLYIPLYMRNRITLLLRKITSNLLSIEIFHKQKIYDTILEQLKDENKQYYCSTDPIIKCIDDKIARKIASLK